jgi:hypothetical protein
MSDIHDPLFNYESIGLPVDNLGNTATQHASANGPWRIYYPERRLEEEEKE